ncbi:Multidrug resistance-associated protein 1, partial [Gryganskiella cystojenkinii]
MLDLQHPFHIVDVGTIHNRTWIDSFCRSKEGWGPVSPDRFGLTPCFEFSVLFATLATVMILGVSIRMLYIVKHCKPHGLGRTAWIYWPTQLAMGFTGVSSLVLAGLMQFGAMQGSSPSAILGYTSIGCSWVMIGLLTLGFVIEAWPRGSTTVQRSSTLSSFEKANIFMQMTFYFWLPIVLESLKRTLTEDEFSNAIPRSSYTDEAYIRFEHFWSRALEKYNARREEARQKNGQRVLTSETKNSKKELSEPSLFTTCLRSLLIYLPALFFFRLARILAQYSVPSILSLFLSYLQDVQREHRQDGQVDSTEGGGEHLQTGESGGPTLAYGLLLVFGMFFGAFMTALLTYSSRHHCIMIGLRVRSALISEVYRKALRLSPGSRSKSTTGEITNHMSVDADKWADSFIFLNMWISGPMEIGIGLWLLFRLLGWSVLAGVFIMVSMTPLQILRAKHFGRIESANLAKMDERIRLTTEVLTAIKVVKLYCWENAFMKRIFKVREEGLVVSTLMGKSFAVMSIVFTSSTLIICLATLSVYATWGGPDFTPGDLTPQKVFVSMTLFAMLRAPIASMTETATHTMSLIVACRRLQKFLLREEINPEDTIRELDVTKRQPIEPMILIEDATFSWSQPSSCSNEDDGEEIDERSELLDGTDSENAFGPKPTLKNINLAFDHGQIVAVVGRVGQGKSSLISSITGEMYKWHGRVKTYGRVAIVPQQAWILNATLRDNVLFGKPYDSERYQRIIHACGLEPDIEMLPAGDMTEIGERGINLSGGQKQRVSLARSAYDDADIYLLDDPLSAVDAHVDHHLWKELIGPKGLLSQKTRILVTHGIHHLQEVDKVVVLKEGRVVEQGHYDDLMKAEQTFYQLILEYSVQYKGSTQADIVANSSPSSMNESVVDSQEGSIDQCDDSVTIQEVSAAVFTSKKPTKKDTKAELISKEKIKDGNVDLSVYKAYFKAFSYTNLILLIVLLMLAQGSLVGVNLWLKYWINVEDQEGSDKPTLRFFLSIFALLTFTYSALNVGTVWVTFVVGRIRASRIIHQILLSRVMHLPGSYFDTTPLGRILNRFSSDLHSVDDRIGWKIIDTFDQAAVVLASIAVIAFTMPIFLLALPFFFLAVNTLRVCFLHASRDGKRMFSSTKSPIFQHFTETLGGVSTIRAMNLEDQFIQENAVRIDCHTNVFVAHSYTIQWMGCQTQLLSALIILVVSLSFVLAPRGSIDASAAGLALSFALTIAQSMVAFVRMSCDLQNHMISMERIMELAQLKTEATLRTDPDSVAGRVLERQAKEGTPWPQRGEI